MEPAAAPRGLGAAFARILDSAENASPVEAVTRGLGALLGASRVSLLIADLSGRALVRLVHDVPDAAGDVATEVLPFDGGPGEETLRTQTVRVLAPDEALPGSPTGQWTVLAPVTERGEALGLLEMSLPDEPGPAVLAEISRTAHLLGFVVIANRRHTDLFEWGQRSTRFSLPAEIQRRLLPASFTCEAGSFTLSAWLEPAATIGGDTFDYSLDREALHLSLTDAMGHGVASALIATLCVGSLRNTRRQGATLPEQALAANRALLDQGREHEPIFATGLLGRMDLETGALALVNAGHQMPYLLRGDEVASVALPPGLPLGLFAEATYPVADLKLEPGDRLVFVTDGMLERDAAGIDLETEIRNSGHLHPRETTRRLADKVLELAGSALQDDATMLVLDWHGHHGRDRDTVAGAGLTQAGGAGG
ncbi:PP2C family protein-serine/threonine phosphatase [Sporichthya sp.]|uniref:PP2C family protein-serine/threonine phosphatase n=1 Tax=Sporichthya sp. TaxID=65475 RepID=UPI001833A1FB|nr:PP2C family protein-serine/threonine phosphatase [Sporichthya sp.]MBA3743040.1 serine/threonine-protein phosphatase [Sporichthya sp.]